MLPLGDERVVGAFVLIERVKHVEPFLNFYPVGELTIEDLNELQRTALIDGDDGLSPEGDSKYVHKLYMAEIDNEHIYLYENVMVMRTEPCNNEETPWISGTCTSYYSISGKPIEGNQESDEMIETSDSPYHIDGADSYKWTFTMAPTDEYTFEKVTRVE